MALRDVIGQDKAIDILLKTIRRDRTPSSYLFAGEPGIGKKLTAINLGKALNCLARQGAPSGKIGRAAYDSQLAAFDSCDECSSCRKIDAGAHPDFLLISPESDQIRIEEIRAIDEVLSLKAFEGEYKVVIVDDAETMNQYAANAFLKTLEEPPGNSLIILISSKPDRLPDTIRSRCPRINFSPLSLEACEEVITKVIGQRQAEGKKSRKRTGKTGGAPSGETPLPTLVRLAMGRPGDVLSDDLIEGRAWSLKLLDEMLGAEKDGWASKEEMKKWFDIILLLLRDMAVTKIPGGEKFLINIDLTELLKKLSSPMDLRVIIKCYQNLNTLKGYLNFNLNKSLTWNYTGSLLRMEMDPAHA